MPIELPTAKTPPSLSPATAKMLVYGAPGIGKTTLAVGLDPDRTLLVATEPGYGGIEAFVATPTSWEELRQLGAELSKGEHDFTTLVLDTADEAFRLCQDFVMREHKIKHPSDLEWGKGWALLTDEFRLRIAKLCNLGMGVVFVSHAKDEKIEGRVGSITKSVPTMSGQAGKFITGFVDYILFCTFDGEGRRVIRTEPSEQWDAKARIALPDPLPLDAQAVKQAMQSAQPKPAAVKQAKSKQSAAAQEKQAA